ncbi:unnamed protein product [marine sediment metagenome]|uniref:Uncharacterized protein n=1 Tax=marine sediment metagenome TaxID=412755 RepID=X0XPL9_9ZZZZ
MVEVDDATFKEIENELRDIINWIKVFEEEYDLPAEVVNQLRTRLEGTAKKLGLEVIK